MPLSDNEHLELARLLTEATIGTSYAPLEIPIFGGVITIIKHDDAAKTHRICMLLTSLVSREENQTIQ